MSVRARFSWLTPWDCSEDVRSGTLFYVDLLISIAHPDQRYVGFTTDQKQRIKSRNDGASIHRRRSVSG